MTDESFPERPLPPPTWRDVLDRFVAPDRARVLAMAGGVVALAVAAVVAWWALRPPAAPATERSLPYAPGAAPGAEEGEHAAGSTSTTATTEPAELVVHAAGAVASPGVHRVAPDARVADLLAAAGGPAPDADLDRVNLAAPLTDGQRVWFPRIGEPTPPAASPAGPGSPDAPGAAVDLNAASAEELEALPGVGPAIARAIVEHRERHGPFGSVEDLLDVRGIGPARLDELRDLVHV